MLRQWRGWLVVIPGVYAAGFVASALYGAPARLPGVALGSPVLLDLERAGVVLAAVAVVSIFAYMTSRGYLPSQLGNIGYQAVDRQHELDERVAELRQELERRIRRLEQGKQTSSRALALIRDDLAVLDRRLAAVEAGSDG